jgi:hypothetical protein
MSLQDDRNVNANLINGVVESGLQAEQQRAARLRTDLAWAVKIVSASLESAERVMLVVDKSLKPGSEARLRFQARVGRLRGDLLTFEDALGAMDNIDADIKFWIDMFKETNDDE